MLLTRIPMFRDVIVISFHCPHCGNSNNEIQESSPIQPEGVEYTVTISEPDVRREEGRKGEGVREGRKEEGGWVQEGREREIEKLMIIIIIIIR